MLPTKIGVKGLQTSVKASVGRIERAPGDQISINDAQQDERNCRLFSVVARGALKMKLSADQTEPEKGGPKELGSGRIVGEGVPMYVIANFLSNMLGRNVINNAGLAGKYNINLQPVTDSLELQSDPADPMSQADVLNFAIIEAVERQLGLRIVSIRTS